MKYKSYVILTCLLSSCLGQQVPPPKPGSGSPVSFVPPPPRKTNPDLAKLSYVPNPIGPTSVVKPVQAPPNLATPASVTPSTTKQSYAGAAAVQNGVTTPGKSGVSTQATPTATKKQGLITDPELRTFSEELLSKDVNNVAKYVTINLQTKLERNDTTDKSPLPLLTVKPEAFKVPSVTKFRALLDNYIMDSAVTEEVTPLERKEENDFLDTIISTPVMQHARQLLMSKGLIKADPNDFKDNLKRLWFTLYSRGDGKIGSSGFEHVFMSELKKGELQGLHNWIYFSDQEAAKKVDYLGYLRNINLGDKGQVVKLRFKYNNQVRIPKTLFIGTSPEFEFALYTVCYLLRADSQCPVKMNGVKFNIKTYNYKYRGVSSIGSAYAEVA
ncbi:poly(U)-specific endoribonuclease homolog [Chrysoperla carnea]|uniref:poly(U)-specific endoribonuclease homolog n=1 Tax=Chrysoperla carnea TaxID=189513 RepID=UPI001D08D3E6|nr:poly(U)-specific endoribonuclease homolog [Chrysoperla carnea]